MTKAQIIQEIVEATGIDKPDVQNTVEAFVSTLKGFMIDGKNVFIRGFGSFVVRKRAKKVARNISKNQEIIIPEHFYPTFKPAKSFAERVKMNNKVKK
ncbi:MAG: integration host factor subunit beta [Bacteroidetes bacterium RIFCSPLOWO2_02_FULL_36_8]|nr:MAG: integration host factor subunit beta [Bacteroidetes bacterium RIFCSPLOWO2_02_FULL_36_8]OFY68721.1 MAG: integration host factor subunit beta [Bacteroidetes bacterium RIFCSPLOWO2_12_FULL_37_12]